MNRQTHNLQQGTQAWHDFRARHFGASELPAAAGQSKYTTRGDLLREKATGITKEVDAHTQALFNKGHAAEASARELAEMIIGDEISPMVMSLEIDGIQLSASLDGVTFDGTIIWEHKLWSEKLAEQVLSENLEPHYRLQIEQQLLVSGAKKCLFMTSDGTADNCSYMWYHAEVCEFEEIVNTWRQFEKDLAAYVPEVAAPIVKAEAIAALPSVFIQATGMVTASNLAEFKEAATTFIANIRTELIVDQDFADAEATVKFCKEAEGNIESVKQSITAQMSSVDEVLRTLDHISAQLRDKRLMLDKLVKNEKEARKLALVRDAAAAMAQHLDALETEIKPIKLALPFADFGAAIKGLKSLSSMQDALSTALANAKIEADAAAKDIRLKLVWCKTNAEGKSALFPDLQQIITKPFDDFTLLITSRIEADQKAREEERQRIEAEARAKVEAEAKSASALATASAEDAAKSQVQLPDSVVESASTKPVDTSVLVIAHQDEISAFMRSREWGSQKEINHTRAILVEFVKYQEARRMKEAA